MQQTTDYQTIEQIAEAYLEKSEIPALSPAESACFSAWAGTTPALFFARISPAALKVELGSGLARTNGTQPIIRALSEAEYRKAGETIAIEYGFGESPFGRCFIALANDAICDIQFTEQNDQQIVEQFSAKWHLSSLRQNDPRIAPIAETLGFSTATRAILLRGTPFQRGIWQTLLSIPYGSLCSYNDVARLAGSPKAIRAAASAVAQNPVGVIVPCHRIIRKEGKIGQFRWGSARKALLIAHEKATV